MRCMHIVPPKNKVIVLKHVTVIEIVNRVQLQSDNVLFYTNLHVRTASAFGMMLLQAKGTVKCFIGVIS